MVADVHRTLINGGIFIYPNSSQYPNGKLRLMYECNPLSFEIEQAGGIAIDCKGRIMEIQQEAIHQRTTIFIGSKQNVLKVKEFLDKYTLEKISNLAIVLMDYTRRSFLQAISSATIGAFGGTFFAPALNQELQEDDFSVIPGGGTIL